MMKDQGDTLFSPTRPTKDQLFLLSHTLTFQFNNHFKIAKKVFEVGTVRYLIV